MDEMSYENYRNSNLRIKEYIRLPIEHIYQ